MRKIILSLLTLSVLSGAAFASQPNYDLRDVVPFNFSDTININALDAVDAPATGAGGDHNLHTELKYRQNKPRKNSCGGSSL